MGIGCKKRRQQSKRKSYRISYKCLKLCQLNRLKNVQWNNEVKETVDEENLCIRKWQYKREHEIKMLCNEYIEKTLQRMQSDYEAEKVQSNFDENKKKWLRDAK